MVSYLLPTGTNKLAVTHATVVSRREAVAYRGVVVAVAAGEDLLAARRHDFASPPVMLAPAR
jgi:hypothetical protein